MNTKELYHYVYRITNIVLQKHYYGKRSSKIEPKLDLGIRYFSSSKDKEFIQDQKINPKNYKYKIISLHKSSEEAINKEIKLHNRFNIGISNKFYNKAKQTHSGFDVTGKTFGPCSEEVKAKISKSNMGKKHTEDAKIKMSKVKLGKKLTEETKVKISKARTGKICTNEVRTNMSKAQAGFNNPSAKIANIYNNTTNEPIALNICISVWAKENGFHIGHLAATARANRSIPSSSNNPHHTKGVYAVYC